MDTGKRSGSVIVEMKFASTMPDMRILKDAKQAFSMMRDYGLEIKKYKLG